MFQPHNPCVLVRSHALNARLVCCKQVQRPICRVEVAYAHGVVPGVLEDVLA